MAPGNTNKSIEIKLNAKLAETCKILMTVQIQVDKFSKSVGWISAMVRLDVLRELRLKLSALISLFNAEKIQPAQLMVTDYSPIDEMLTEVLSIVQSCKKLLIKPAAYKHLYKLRDIELRVIDILKILKDEKYAGVTPHQNTSTLEDVASDYSYALDILDKYDHQQLETTDITDNSTFTLHYRYAKRAINELKDKFGGSVLFGNEKDNSFEGSINAVYQTFDGLELYPSVEEKAANLLYFIVKNHSFSDGNKRIAAFTFVWFMAENRLLYKNNGAKRIADNALVAITLLIAESKAEEKEMLVKVVVNLINLNN